MHHDRRFEEQRNPLDAARALGNRPGRVFLESTLSGPGNLSILASDPDLVLTGRDWDALQAQLATRQREHGGTGSPDGAAIGWVSFDGSFYFSFYDRVHVFSHASDGGNLSRTAGPARRPAAQVIDFKPRLEKEKFLSMVAGAREYIAAGDIYQVCLSHPFAARTQADPWAFYESLRESSPAPYSAFLSCGSQSIASASPECFLRMSGRKISTRPIKGTRPRRPDSVSDLLNALDLTTSAKEAAELTMITDLERNDLGQVCEFGSVRVTELLKLEKFEQVFHLVSTVEGELRPDVSHVDALRACFPGGSISGAPKKRALEIISELEPFPRGIYTGAIGYFGYNGESQFSIAIRTAIFERETASFHVGAGIVADSIPEREWQETLDKAAGLLLAAGRNP